VGTGFRIKTAAKEYKKLFPKSGNRFSDKNSDKRIYENVEMMSADHKILLS